MDYLDWMLKSNGKKIKPDSTLQLSSVSII